MRKKDKRKKSDQELLNESDSSSTKKDKKNDYSASTSRSRSRQRRSLSSLFRRSGSRPRSEEKRKENDHNVDEELNFGANPRTNPRDHLKRMTVREALVYDRRRGRSPNRRALRLEKKVLNNESNLNSELSASLPYLTDIVPTEDQTAVPEVSSSSAEARSGSTLPRSKRKKRNRLDGDSAQINSHTLSGSNISTNQILPLDKRKYLIKKDNGNSKDMIDSIANSDHHMNPTLVHSKMSLDLHKSDRTLSDSYNQFITLREKRSPLTLSPVDVPDSTPLLSRSKSPQERGRTTSRNDSTPSVLDHSVFSFMTNKRPSVHYDNHHHESIIPVPERDPNGHENVKRSSYVSPRRFSRATRPSVTSFKSDMSETSVFTNSSDPKSTNPDVSGNAKVKYQRHFSRDRKHTSDKQLTVNDLETEPLNALIDINKSTLTEPQKIDASTSMSDISLQNRKPSTSSSQEQAELQHKNAESNINETIIEKELPKDGENIIKPSEDSAIKAIDDHLQEQENNQSLSPFLREVIVIDSNAELPDMSDNDHERVFRPIQTENSGSGDQLSKTDSTEDILEERKSENAVDNIHLISSDIQVENDTHEDHNNKVSKPKKNSKFSFKRRKSSKVKKNDKQKEALKETDEKEHTDSKKLRPGKSRKEKRKSKKHNESSSKESQDENKSLVVACENDVSQKVEESGKLNDKKLNKTKSILKKASKDGSKKRNKVKPIKRTSSLNNLSDPRENQVREERRQSLTISGKRSMSMDNINVEKEPLVKSVTLKDEKSKINIETANDKTVKSSKPQPKLSLLAIITMRAKISRMKKARQAREANKKTSEDNESSSGRPEVSSNAENETETSDLSVAKVFYENEINTSIGKSDNSIEIIEATDKEVKDIVFEKQVQFSPFCDDTMSEEEMIKQRQRNTRLTSRRESKVRQRQKKVISCCKKFVAFLFSHIGLCSVVVAYCILGGVIFKTLEGESEIEKKKEIREITLNYTEKIYRLAFEKSQTKGNREDFKSDVNKILKEFSVVIHKQTKEAGWDGKEIRLNLDRKEGEPEAEPEQWSYPSSLLYAITVMTTIGYGHVAPKTDEGRIATIAYAVFGIPLTLLCLTNIGDVMAHGFRMLYGKVCCGVCCILFRPRRRRRLDPEKGISAGEERLIMQENEKSGEVIHVPTSVCLLLMSSYIMLGTILFAKWEGWDMVTGTYFCFITLSTIGFGDVVPGMSSQAWTDQNEKLVSCALYLVFGLSLIAMCFNLVQEDVKDKCKRLGKRLGIIDK